MTQFNRTSDIIKIENDYTFSESEIQGFIKTKQDFIDGKTTARDWKEVKEELEFIYGK